MPEMNMRPRRCPPIDYNPSAWVMTKRSGTHVGSLDAVEEENLKHHDDRCDGVHVGDVEGGKPLLA
jgi:hypothetical protein